MVEELKLGKFPGILEAQLKNGIRGSRTIRKRLKIWVGAPVAFSFLGYAKKIIGRLWKNYQRLILNLRFLKGRGGLL